MTKLGKQCFKLQLKNGLKNWEMDSYISLF